MNIAVGQSINSDIYVENDYENYEDYEGKLEPEDLHQVNSVDWVGWFQDWLNFLSQITTVPQDCELSLRLTGDRQIQQYNYQYRQLDRSTDVLAFASTEVEIILPAEFTEPLYLGDIIISLDTAKRQAREQKHALTVELAWLASHGLLHLLGWDHPDDNSLAVMLDKQRELIYSLKYFKTI
jgi:probable rRNA maturation factor